MLTLITALALATPAHAFCGTYMGQAGSDLFNGASQLAVVRQGKRTTLTLANDYQGDLSAFALVVPVPEILSPDDVSVVEPSVIQALDAYSAPRRVSYSCNQDTGGWDSSMDGGNSDTGSASGETADGVTVEAEFTEGEYTIVVLSATESGGLVTWLQDNGYAIPDGAQPVLDEYIDAGSYFFAAQVQLDQLPEGQSWLSPLQFGYDSDVFSLPIRLGTINSPGAQDLIVYALNDQAAGQVHISNYNQVTIEDDCLWPADTMEFGTFYGSTFQEALTDRPEAGWVLEYAWATGSCDPCSSDPPSQEVVDALGYQGDAWDSFFTRLHMRYTPAQVQHDLVFYQSGITDSEQLRYIDHDECLEDSYPLCALPDGQSWPAGTGDGDDSDDDDKKGLGCGAPISPTLALLPGVLLALGLRRRRDRL